MAKDLLTDEQVELEIDRLCQSEAVKLAQAEQRFKLRRRKYLYTLRWYEKRGKLLLEQGVTPKAFEINDEDMEADKKTCVGDAED